MTTAVHPLKKLLAERIYSGLRRKSITSCSKWSEEYRIMGQPLPGPFRFDHHPWCRDMHDCTSEKMVGMKGAQLGFTETALNKVFFAIDVNGTSVLYMLPASTPDAHDFSTSRFDPALESSAHLKNLFSDVKNIGHKRAGHANLFIRGSRSRSQLKSIPVGLTIFDEVDEMVQDNITLAFERMSGQVEKQAFLLSTPTIENFGIHKHFLQSTQEYFHFRCPHCGKLTTLTFPDSLVITAENYDDPDIYKSHIVCHECKSPLNHAAKTDWLSTGRWVAKYPDRRIRGFHVSQLFSTVLAPSKIALDYLNAQTNPTDEQEFWNSTLGRTHTVKGARITDKEIDDCMGSYVMGPTAGQFITMGIDVGKKLHYEIASWSLMSNRSDIHLSTHCKVIAVGSVPDFEDLDVLMQQYSVHFAVIDAQPERRKSTEFAKRNGNVKICFYGRGIRNKVIHEHSETESAVTVDRTSWLDTSLSRFKPEKKRITLPRDLPLEYRQHLKALTRVYKKDSDGNPVGRYIKNENEPDHLAHARNYAEIALELTASLIGHQSIRSVN